MEYETLDTYTGGWKYGKRHGTGFMKCVDGTTYDGDYVLGKRHGFGTLSYPDGRTYVGEFKNGEKHGAGPTRFIDPGGLRGEWRGGRQISSGPVQIRCGLEPRVISTSKHPAPTVCTHDTFSANDTFCHLAERVERGVIHGGSMVVPGALMTL